MLPKPSPCPVLRRPDGGPFVIAEIGVNHEGKMDLAKRLIDEAVEGGADAVKFQTYKAGKLASKNSPSYWNLDYEPTRSQFKLFQKYDAFDAPEFQALAEYAAKKKVAFCSTPFDLDAAEMLDPLVPFFKIASADITNFPLLEACAAKGKPVLMSTGASTLEEIEEATAILRKHLEPSHIGILHCVLEYPTPYPDANLAVLHTLGERFPEYTLGYSDHTLPDPSMAVLLRAWMLGATVIEKHFTHDKTLPGNDHYHAMNREDLKIFRSAVECLLTTEGSAEKRVLPAEEISRRNARRSLVATRDLPAGHVLTREDLMAKRPAFGLPPGDLPRVLGRKLARDLAEDDFLTEEHLEN